MLNKMSYSQMTAFKRCRLQWWFGYKLGLEPKKPSRALLFGDLIHRLLADYYRGAGAREQVVKDFRAEALARYDTLFDEEVMAIDDDIDMALAIVRRYESFAASNDDWEVLAVEVPFSLGVRRPNGKRSVFSLTGIIDLLVKDGNRGVWVVEHKTAAAIPDEESLVLDDQLTAYAYAVRQLLGVIPQGIWYNVLRKKLPSVPKLNKDGSLKRDKRIDTEPEVFVDAVLAAGQNPEEYADIIEHITAYGKPFFWRARSYRTEGELEKAAEQLYLVWRDINNPSKRIYRSPQADCMRRCAFYEPCVLMQKGGDLEYVLEANYRRKEGRDGRQGSTKNLGSQLLGA